MGLTLTSRDVAAFKALQETLLSPLDHPTVDEWCLAVLRRTDALFRADRSAFLLPIDGQIHHVSENIEPRYLAAFRQGIKTAEPGALRYSEVLVDQAFERRRTKRLEVWRNSMVSQLAGRSNEELVMWHECVKPAGIDYGQAISVPLPAGETYLGVAHSRPADDPFGEEAGLELMSMLVPAFKAGVRTLVMLAEQREGLAARLDALGQALLLIDPSGADVHRSPKLTELLATDPERERIVDVMRRHGRALVAPRSRQHATSLPSAAANEFATATAHYRIHASFVPSGFSGPSGAGLVLLERLTPILPAPGRLVEHFELTRREAEIALLLARGLSNREVAARLGVSHHTVRHHAEWVFTKLGVHTRKALALRLMTADRD